MTEHDVRAWIIGYVSEFLGIAAADIRSDRDFADLGLDSADAIIVCGAMEDRFDVELDATLFLRNDTIDVLIADLRRSGLLE